MNLSIIIINWNSTQYLRDCLASIYRVVTGLSFEIIVVDNASSDDSCVQMLRKDFPDTTLIACETNHGFAKACNLGFRQCSGDALLFLNPDTELPSNALAPLFQELTSHSKVGAVGPLLLNTDGSVQTSCVQAFPTILNQVLDSEWLRRRTPTSRLWGMQALFSSSSRPREVEAVSGACLMVNRGTFEAIGGFDERYFMYVEDLDLCHRIQRAGFAVHYVGSCSVVHHGGKSSASQGRSFVTLQQKQALAQYFRQAKGQYYSALYRVCLGLSSLLRLAIISPRNVLMGRLASASSSGSFNKWRSIFRWSLGIET